MSLEDIIKKINSDTVVEVGDIIGSAERKAGAILAEADKTLREKSVLLAKRAEDKAAQVERYITVQANLEARNLRMAEKARHVDGVYASVRDKILSLNKSETVSLIEKLMVMAAETGREEVIFPKKISGLFDSGFFHRVNKSFGSGKLRPSGEHGDFEWGFMLRGEGYLADYSLDAVLDSLRERTETEVSKILFPGDN